jgi:hypothetical protein
MLMGLRPKFKYNPSREVDRSGKPAFLNCADLLDTAELYALLNWLRK